MSKKILVIGASGQVGEHLMRVLQTSQDTIVGTYGRTAREHLVALDIRDVLAVRKLVQDVKPTIIYMPASLTHVDYCEQHPDESYQTNVVGVSHVVQEARAIGAKLVYFSSDYVFGGLSGPYDEATPVNPVNVYGWHKVAAEHTVAFNMDNYLILRTTVVYGPESQGKNFIYRLLGTLRAGETLRVPDDQVGNPTFGPDLAQATVKLVQQDARGLFNIVGLERVSRLEFAQAAAHIFGLDVTLVEGISTSALQQIAKRPLKAGLLTDKLKQHIGRYLIGYEDGLRQFKTSMDENQ